MNTRRVRLGSVCTIVSGSTPKSEVAEYWDGDIKWITPAELTEDSYIITDSVRHITSRAVHDTSLKPFPEGTVILSSRAPIGKTAIAGCEMYCNQGFKNLICSPQIDPKYLYCFLSGKTDFLNSLGRGATFKEISKAIVENIEIPLPELAVQRRIALQFEHIRALIRQYREQLHFLDQLVKSRFIEMFGDPIQNPMAWQNGVLASICKKITDGEHGSVPRVDAGVIFLNAKHVKKEGSIDWTTVTYISNEVHNKIYARCNPEPGDILLTTTGTIGNVAIVPDIAPFSMDRGITLLKPDGGRVNNRYLASLLNFDCIQTIMNANVHASAIGHLFLNKVMQIPIIVPPLDKQEKFAAFVEQTDKSKLAVQQSIDQLETLKKSLMQKYFG